MRSRNLCLAIAAASLLLSQGIAAARPRATAQVGEKAPAFELSTADGKTVSLADHRGKIVVLEWTNHQCPVVGRYVAKQKIMQSTAAKLKDREVVWLSIDSSNFCKDKIEDIRRFRKENGITYPLLLDPDGKVGRFYNAKTTPHMFVIDQAGNLVYTGSLDDDRHGDAESPRNYVAEAVNSLLNGSAVAVSKTKPFGCSVKYRGK